MGVFATVVCKCNLHGKVARGPGLSSSRRLLGFHVAHIEDVDEFLLTLHQHFDEQLKGKYCSSDLREAAFKQVHTNHESICVWPEFAQIIQTPCDLQDT